MLAATLVSLSVVFVAEFGDKSQLMTMTYALRHRWWVVLSGVGIASFMVHGLSVTIGHFLGLTLPERPKSVRCGDRLPAVCGVDMARGSRGRTRRGGQGRRTATRPAGRHLLVRPG
jgi:putative Ca2+/H+ antiporter (TMEM165/GDT1 family)